MLRVHVTPTVRVAATVWVKPLGHWVMDMAARQPAVTLLHLRGHVSVCAEGVQVTPTFAVGRCSMRQPRAQVRTPRRALHPIVVPTVRRVHPDAHTTGAVEHCTRAVHLRVGRRGVGRREGLLLLVGRREGARVRRTVVVMQEMPAVLVAAAVWRQPTGHAVVPSGAMQPAPLRLQGEGSAGQRDRPHVTPLVAVADLRMAAVGGQEVTPTGARQPPMD